MLQPDQITIIYLFSPLIKGIKDKLKKKELQTKGKDTVTKMCFLGNSTLLK